MVARFTPMNNLEQENHRLHDALASIAHGATACDHCGVEYVDAYEGPCQELIRWEEPTIPCPGHVSARGIAKAALS